MLGSNNFPVNHGITSLPTYKFLLASWDKKMGVRSNNIAQIMVRKWISLPLCLYKTQRKYGENAQILVKWAFSLFWSRFWPMTHQRFFHHQFLSFFLFHKKRRSKEVWNICGDKCRQHSDCKLCSLCRKYRRYLIFYCQIGL